MDVHAHRCGSRPGGHAVQRISRGTALFLSTVGAGIQTYPQHTLAEKPDAAGDESLLCNSAVEILPQDREPNKKTQAAHFHSLASQL